MFVLKVELEASIPEISSSDSALHVPDSWFWEQIDQSINAPLFSWKTRPLIWKIYNK